MKKASLKILALLESGKITSDEAVKLLEAVKKNDGISTSFDSEDVQEKLSNFSAQVDTFAKDVGGKMGSAFKEMEPKVKKATKVVFEKTAKVVDEISKSLNETLKNMETEDCCEDTDCCCGEVVDCCIETTDCCAENAPAACCSEDAAPTGECCCGNDDNTPVENK